MKIVERQVHKQVARCDKQKWGILKGLYTGVSGNTRIMPTALRPSDI